MLHSRRQRYVLRGGRYITALRDRIESFYDAYCCGEYESLTRWLWIYGHVSILLCGSLRSPLRFSETAHSVRSLDLLATALSGYAVAKERYLLALVPFPLVYLYKRYEKARTYKLQSDTPV